MSIASRMHYTHMMAFYAGMRCAARDHWMIEAKKDRLGLKSFYVSLARCAHRDMMRYISDMRREDATSRAFQELAYKAPSSGPRTLDQALESFRRPLAHDEANRT